MKYCPTLLNSRFEVAGQTSAEQAAKQVDGQVGGGQNAKQVDRQTSAEQAAGHATQTGYAGTTIFMDLAPEIADQLQKLKGEGSWNDLMKQLLQARESQLEAKKPEPVKTESKHIPAKIEKFVLVKTNGTCAFPGCTKKYEILHHTQRFSLEKVHDPDRLVPLCKAHERLAHLGLIENEQLAPKYWEIREYPNKKNPTYAVDKLVLKYQSGFV